ncbi:hypothetical protein EDC35_10446 [Thiobaca trueperi]|uniref:Uncharacterized protein n=1 Tax=Thiobaca trueperi TaxID=127458 RepID=A0A4R3N2C3_9GAMM|nr:hypothetical protein EDC35_10446 [Thiobaca trueperi]
MGRYCPLSASLTDQSSAASRRRSRNGQINPISQINRHHRGMSQSSRSHRRQISKRPTAGIRTAAGVRSAGVTAAGIRSPGVGSTAGTISARSAGVAAAGISTAAAVVALVKSAGVSTAGSTAVGVGSRGRVGGRVRAVLSCAGDRAPSQTPLTRPLVHASTVALTTCSPSPYYPPPPQMRGAGAG